RSGLSDFGDGRFREGLGVLIGAFNARDGAHAFGRIVFSNHVVSLLVNRLKIQADLTRHPEILDVPLARPLFITGLPRSGTTFLHRLMSEDPAGRTLRTWEGQMPSPPPTYETYRTDPRIALRRRQDDLANRLSPRLAMAHEVAAESPEEDIYLFARDFQSVMFETLFEVPEYTRWLRRRDLGPSYHYARRQLQLLSWKYRADHWVLKAPAHLSWLEELLDAFPDASVIVTHRDPLQVVSSWCSLMAGVRSIRQRRPAPPPAGRGRARGLRRAPRPSVPPPPRPPPRGFLLSPLRGHSPPPTPPLREPLPPLRQPLPPQVRRGAPPLHRRE